MNKRPLGKSGLSTLPLILGGNVFGWTADEATSFRVLDAFVDAGFDAIDTADMYSRWVPGHKGGESETVLGRWMKARGNRAKVKILTKVGLESALGKGLSRAHILSSLEASLGRLQTDYVDLYQSHMDDPQTPVEETLGTFAELVKQGRVRAIGASNFEAPRLGESAAASRKLALPAYQTLQPLYNLYDRAEFEATLAPLCQKEGISVIPYYTLAAGYLTGKYRKAGPHHQTPRGERIKRYTTERGERILSAMDQVAASEGTTLPRIAVAWLRDRPTVAAPIASATSLEQLQELIEGVRLQLSAESLGILDQASA